VKMNVRTARLVIFLSALLLLGLGAATPSLADPLYSNLGPGNTFIINRDWQTNFDFMATPFVTTSGGNLGDILTPLFSLDNPVSIGLYTDSSGQPGTLLEGWSIDAPGFPGILTTIASVTNPLLSADTQYWLVITLTDAQKNELAWYENDQGIDGGIWAGNSLTGLISFEPASPAPAIQLDMVGSTSAMPEPGSGTLLAGLALILMLSRAAGRRVWLRA